MCVCVCVSFFVHDVSQSDESLNNSAFNHQPFTSRLCFSYFWVHCQRGTLVGATRFDADSNQNPCRCRYSNNDFITLLRLYPFTSKVVSLHLSSKLFYVGTCDLPRSSLCAAEHSCRFGLLFPDFILTSQSVDDVVVCVLAVDGTEYVVTMERKRNFTSPCCDLWQAQYTHGRVSLISSLCTPLSWLRI